MPYQIPYLTAIVNRDTMTAAPAVVLAHEVEVLRAVHGDEAVSIGPLDVAMNARLTRVVPDAGGEFLRLQNRYGVDQSNGADYVSMAFGSIREFTRVLEELNGQQAETFMVDIMSAEGAQTQRVSSAEVDAVMREERERHNAQLVEKDGNEQTLRDQIAELEARLAASESGGTDTPTEPPETQNAPELLPVADMDKPEVMAELTQHAVDFDGRAGVGSLRSLLAETRNAAAVAEPADTTEAA